MPEMPAIYTSALIYGPAFIIVLALCVALLVIFPYAKMWIGIGMAIFGYVELSLVPNMGFLAFSHWAEHSNHGRHSVC